MKMQEESRFEPPVTYEDWLNCFNILKQTSTISDAEIVSISKGFFAEKDYICVQFHQNLAETVNLMINNRTAVFIKNLEKLISFNEISGITSLFVKLRNEINRCLFFTQLDFLDKDFKQELERSLKAQTQKFWTDILAHLHKESLEFSNPDLEDSLFLIRRIKLF